MSSRSSARRKRIVSGSSELRDAGVTQFNIYLMNGEEEDSLDLYGREVVGQVATASV